MDMTPEDFRELCDELGYEVEYTIDPDETDGERTPLYATNENGDTIYYRKSLNTGKWVIDLSPEGYTLDTEEFTENEFRVKDGELIIENASGTRPTSGFGNAGFAHATFKMGESGAKVVETH